MHDPAPVVLLKLPAVHRVAKPPLQDEPAGQGVHDDAPAPEYDPLGHTEGEEAPLTQTLPAGHVAQALSPVLPAYDPALHKACTPFTQYEPNGHWTHELDDAREYVPLLHCTGAPQPDPQ